MKSILKRLVSNNISFNVIFLELQSFRVYLCYMSYLNNCRKKFLRLLWGRFYFSFHNS